MHRMKGLLGMPALIEFSTVEENVLLCQELGLDFVELNMNMPYCFPENLEPRDLRMMAKDMDVVFSMHMPDDLDLGSMHEQIRKGTLDRAIEVVDWAVQADIGLLNFHINPGIYFTLPNYKVWIFDKYYESFEKNIIQAFGLLLDRARAGGVQICVENVCNFDLPFIQRVLVPLTKLPGMGLTWDVGHDAKTGFKERETLMKHEANLRHMHLHDHDGRSDHQVLFTGHLDILGLYYFAKNHDMSIVVETKTIDSLIRSISELKSRA
ncbi:MAG: Xylose isomerase-like TIM barrel [Methanomassiliicoccales archaeon PtaU1.Bin124]|nr:MAG: Xylose isomerase-like TIM barrel [Methanomassiliicoccales archaeon PtaU1.Bin124]